MSHLASFNNYAAPVPNYRPMMAQSNGQQRQSTPQATAQTTPPPQVMHPAVRTPVSQPSQQTTVKKSGSQPIQIINAITGKSIFEDDDNVTQSTFPENDEKPSAVQIEVPASRKIFVIDGPINYDDGQWSPANIAGKKYYSRDQLLKLKDQPISAKPPVITKLPDSVVQSLMKNNKDMLTTILNQTMPLQIRSRDNLNGRGQWSPANIAGKKYYSRDQLLKLKDQPISAKPPVITKLPDSVVQSLMKNNKDMLTTILNQTMPLQIRSRDNLNGRGVTSRSFQALTRLHQAPFGNSLSGDYKEMLQIVDDFGNDKFDVEGSMTKLMHLKVNKDVLVELYNKFLDRKHRDRENLMIVICEMLKQNKVTDQVNRAALRETMEMASNMSCDVPLVYEYIAHYLGELLVASVLTFQVVYKICNSDFLSKGNSEKMQQFIFEFVGKQHGALKLQRIINESDCNLEQLISEGNEYCAGNEYCGSKSRRQDLTTRTMDQIQMEEEREQRMINYQTRPNNRNERTSERPKLGNLATYHNFDVSMSQEEIDKNYEEIIRIVDDFRDDKFEVDGAMTKLTPLRVNKDVLVELYNKFLDRKHHDRENLMMVICEMLKQNKVTVEMNQAAIREIMEMAFVMVCDVPRVYEYIAQFLGELLVAAVITFHGVYKICNSDFQSKGNSEEMLQFIFEQVEKRHGAAKLQHIIDESDCNLEQFISGENLNSWRLEVNDLTNIVRCATNGIEDVMFQIKQMLVEKKEYETINAYITSNDCISDPNFIRSLTNVVIEQCCEEFGNSSTPSYKLQNNRLVDLSQLLHRYIDGNLQLELKCIKALQSFVHAREYPSGLLNSTFEILYDNDVLSVQAFELWKNSKDQGEGKDVAICSTRRFFNILAKDKDEEPEYYCKKGDSDGWAVHQNNKSRTQPIQFNKISLPSLSTEINYQKYQKYSRLPVDSEMNIFPRFASSRERQGRRF